MDFRELIARRVAQELRDNTLVNLGIGLPTSVARFVPPGLRVYFQSENGIIGFGARPPEGMEDVHLTDAGGAFVSALPGSLSDLTVWRNFQIIRCHILEYNFNYSSKSAWLFQFLTHFSLSPTGC
jgi:3-oxoacid CoA-transferase B subunit